MGLSFSRNTIPRDGQPLQESRSSLQSPPTPNIPRRRPTSAFFTRSQRHIPERNETPPPPTEPPPVETQGQFSLADLMRRELEMPQNQPTQSRRRSRLTRVSSSFTTHIPNIFTRHNESVPLPSPAQYSRPQTSQTQDPYSSPLQLPSLDPDWHDRPLSIPHTLPRRYRNHDIARPLASIADRIQSLTPARDLSSRLAASIRTRRRARRMSGDDESQSAVLSRLLSVAAAATAASLMGNNPEDAVNDLQRAANAVPGDDGTFDGFLHSLRSGRLASHLGRDQEGTESIGGSGNPASLDFFRMFRFGSVATAQAQRRSQNDSSRPSSSHSRFTSHSTSGESRNDDLPEGRMVPILIVGIRSLHNNDAEHTPEQGDAMPSFLDALAHFPSSVNVSTTSEEDEAAMLDNERHRNSTNTLWNRDNTRRLRFGDSIRPRSEMGPSPSTGTSTPQGTYPPPTTPASPLSSGRSTGTSTPSRRASMPPPSAFPSRREASLSSRREAALGLGRASALNTTPEETNHHLMPRINRDRRSSQNEFMRYGSGSSRRNGVVEPDHPPDREGNRSWIIYVLGGSYPENHPILTTPSLFTDSPTYEDMLLLSSMLGPVKPPVANEEDIASAGGNYTVIESGHGLAASPYEIPIEGCHANVSEEKIPINIGENCLVCLCDYEENDTLRRLNKCGHLYHRECIDHVSLCFRITHNQC